MLSAHAAATPVFLMMEEPLTPARADESALDFALMARIGDGDHDAFRQLVERHQHAVTGTVTKMLGNSSDAQDIAQQVFLRIWRHAKRYRPDAKFTTYLFTITRDEREQHSKLLLEAPHDRQPDAQILQAELQRAVDTAIIALPKSQRMAVVLWRYKQLSYEEIASVLGLSVSAVKSLLFRARTALRDDLRRYLDH
jgi:RNA polymerase sigma-70 factor (ECF subfamily)